MGEGKGRGREREEFVAMYIFLELHWVIEVLEYNPLGISPKGLLLNCIVFMF